MQINSRLKSNFYFIIGVISFLLFLLSLFIHLFTFWYVNLQEQFSSIFLLHIGILILVIPIIKINEKQKIKAVSLEEFNAIGSEENFNELINRNKVENYEIKFPRWLVIVLLILAIYMAINFCINIVGVKGGPSIIDSKYVIQSHGQIIKEITKQEFDIASAIQLRGMSGHWIFFYFYFASLFILEWAKSSAIIRQR